MKMSSELTPWHTFKDDDECYNKYSSVKQISKSHTRTNFVPSKSTQLLDPIPVIQNQANYKQLLKSYHSKRLSVIQITQPPELSQERMVFVKNNQCKSIQYNVESKLHKTWEARSKIIDRTKSQDLIKRIIEVKQKNKYVVPIKMESLVQANRQSRKMFRSKSLNVAHNHIKYYKQKIKQKENSRLEIEKEQKFEELLKSLPRLQQKSNSRKKKRTDGFNSYPSYPPIAGILEPTLKPINTERKQYRIAPEHFLDQLFQKFS